MIAPAIVMLLVAAPVPPLVLDRLTPTELAAALEEDEGKRVAKAIDSLARCLPTAKDASSCGATTDCEGVPLPWCAAAEAEAWEAYARHYLALLKADPSVNATATEAQNLWEKSQATDCALNDAIIDRREIPYRSFKSNQCYLEKISERALAYRGYVIALYGDAEVQGGVPYPGKAPVTVPK